MMLVMTERPQPPDFDIDDDAQVARHCRYAVDAIAGSKGAVHWLGSYATDDRRLFGVLAVESEAALDAWIARAGIQGAVTVRRVVRRLDPSLAAPLTSRAAACC